MIQTSYFRKPGLPADRAVAISLGVPRGWKGRRYPALAPMSEMLMAYRMHLWTWEKYAAEYPALILGRLDPLAVARELDGAIMCCWERSDNPHCHRRLVAEWLAAAAGEEVPEWELTTDEGSAIV